MKQSFARKRYCGGLGSLASPVSATQAQIQGSDRLPPGVEEGLGVVEHRNGLRIGSRWITALSLKVPQSSQPGCTTAAKVCNMPEMDSGGRLGCKATVLMRSQKGLRLRETCSLYKE